MAIANSTSVSWAAYAPGTIAVYVTRLKREFNACKTPRCIYPSIFNRFPAIQAWSLKVCHFSTFLHILASPVYVSGIFSGTNVTWIEREFNVCQTPRSMYPSIFNRFWDIASYWSKIATFSHPISVYSGLTGGDPVGISRRSWYTQN